ncbi:Homeo [Glarea lozoyensis ATCC 20868]|uniref:Homeo n=2 Tax=Glarea lozoyensis TaxID=101852 RepID=S3DYF3_GLAL2|nr:Homeo [Glarea lozoyensis ATCC 20868]EPE36966.1 Homeo [Glarea lozoyensis ATCC 20868]
MDDKTRNTLQPSATFDDSSSNSNFAHQLTTSTASPTQSRSFAPSSINSIVSGMDQSTTMERKNPMAVQASLMSPPEALPRESFSRPSTAESKQKSSFPSSHGRFNPPLSPPVSPESTASSPDSPASVTRDPILFPTPDTASVQSSQPPLFFEPDHQRLVAEHVRARDSSVFREASPPRPIDYQLALEFKSQIAKGYNANRKVWHMRELAQLKEDDALRQGGRRYTPIAPAFHGPRKSGGRGTGTRVNGNGSVVKPHVRAPKPPRDRQSTPDGGAKRVAREDKDFNSLPDYAPPLSSLPNKPNSLKVDWKGAPIDLKSDPHVHLLHPDEVALAANLRLDCATYLTSKRRIFIKRIEAFRINKEFRKTDAQQACKIDVNKASKLWAAFDKVGWLHQHWIEKYA